MSKYLEPKDPCPYCLSFNCYGDCQPPRWISELVNPNYVLTETRIAPRHEYTIVGTSTYGH